MDNGVCIGFNLIFLPGDLSLTEDWFHSLQICLCLKRQVWGHSSLEQRGWR